MNIEISNVVKKYGILTVLDVEELTFKSGHSYGIVGPNGSGKTTLFKCITNIITDYSGTVLIDGRDVREVNEILLSVGIVLDGMSVYENQTGLFNIEYFSKLRGEYNSEFALELARELELEDVLKRQVRTYSYGMIKKLILLIALLHEPKILILDEPFRGLDAETVSWFKKYLKKLTDKGMTLLISSHVKEDIVSLCEEVVVIKKGQIDNQINLAEFQEKLIRDVVTTNQDGFIAILEATNYYYQVRSTGIRVNIRDERWKSVKDQLDQQGIDITSLAIVHILDNKMN
ncbi:ATP-binding cassette domain-containing protein [Vagococcus silagei]|uniref:ABC transporter ATP-binding protein n=1 Tax=Vagococcus silagei TaxID=2508885 RepID=A0A4S3B9Z0_9ENTE|nr:ABC transporter ATP-binding protein [Vagococcus silagei]THB62025.1 ABC transporter ATP-binding protein [Vagococcus silagei]